jgi:hypothetical protein
MCKVTCFQHVFTFRMSRVPFIHLAQKRINISSHLIHFLVIIRYHKYDSVLFRYEKLEPQSLPAGRHPAGHEAIFLAAWSAPSAAFKPFFLRNRRAVSGRVQDGILLGISDSAAFQLKKHGLFQGISCWGHILGGTAGQGCQGHELLLGFTRPMNDIKRQKPSWITLNVHSLHGLWG